MFVVFVQDFFFDNETKMVECDIQMFLFHNLLSINSLILTTLQKSSFIYKYGFNILNYMALDDLGFYNNTNKLIINIIELVNKMMKK